MSTGNLFYSCALVALGQAEGAQITDIKAKNEVKAVRIGWFTQNFEKSWESNNVIPLNLHAWARSGHMFSINRLWGGILTLWPRISSLINDSRSSFYASTTGSTRRGVDVQVNCVGARSHWFLTEAPAKSKYTDPASQVPNLDGDQVQDNTGVGFIEMNFENFMNAMNNAPMNNAAADAAHVRSEQRFSAMVSESWLISASAEVGIETKSKRS
jgi:hypothetical protein